MNHSCRRRNCNGVLYRCDCGNQVKYICDCERVYSIHISHNLERLSVQEVVSYLENTRTYCSQQIKVVSEKADQIIQKVLQETKVTIDQLRETYQKCSNIIQEIEDPNTRFRFFYKTMERGEPILDNIAQQASWENNFLDTLERICEPSQGHQNFSKVLKVLEEPNNLVFNLSGEEIGDEGAVVLAKTLPLTQVKKLYIQGNSIGQEGARAIAKAIPDSNLEELYLYKNSIGNQGLKAIAEKLPLSQLKVLNLSGNSLCHRGIKVLIEALLESQIETLNLSCNSIGNEGAEWIGSYLSEFETLKTLDLSVNSISDISLLLCMISNSSLRALYLSNNPLQRTFRNQLEFLAGEGRVTVIF